MQSTSVSVDLWCWRLDGPQDELLRLEAELSADEKDRASRFVFDRHRREYIWAHGRMRQILGRLIGASASELRFVHGDHGKPALQGNELHFNLSHAGGYAALATTAEVEVGVDIERIRPVEKLLAAMFFSQTENESLTRLSDEDWLSGFFRIWTGKEAVIKAIGLGLSLDLSSFDIDLSRDQGRVVVPLQPNGDREARLRYRRMIVEAVVIGCIAVRADREISISRHDP